MAGKYQFRQMDWESAEYAEELNLRNRILRVPLGMNLFEENLEKEKNDFHLGAFAEGRLVGVLILTPLSDRVLKMRQVAVDSDFQGRGVGKGLVRFSEIFAVQKGFSKFELNARQPAVPFYKGLGYCPAGKEFFEVGIPHLKMEKELQLG